MHSYCISLKYLSHCYNGRELIGINRAVILTKRPERAVLHSYATDAYQIESSLLSLSVMIQY